MKIAIDTDSKRLVVDGRILPLYSREAFELVSDLWLKVGWELKYPYTFSWLGFPILQIPEDMLRIQEVIFRVKPDVIIETGVAHGGSLIYYASLCKVMGNGRVVGIEKGLRCREAIEAHQLAPLIQLCEGSSTDPWIVDGVSRDCRGKKVLVILDSNHSKEHVARELECYHGIISPGSYIVATDGNMADLHDVPRGSPEWKWNNPQEAALEFASRHPEFTIEQPSWPFNESALTKNVTYWPSAFLRRA